MHREVSEERGGVCVCVVCFPHPRRDSVAQSRRAGQRGLQRSEGLHLLSEVPIGACRAPTSTDYTSGAAVLSVATQRSAPERRVTQTERRA